MSSAPNESPRGQNEKDAAATTAQDASVVVADNGSTNDSPPTSSSQTSPPAEKPAAPAGPPNGGLQAWLHILGSFLLYFNTWGKSGMDGRDATPS